MKPLYYTHLNLISSNHVFELEGPNVPSFTIAIPMSLNLGTTSEDLINETLYKAAVAKLGSDDFFLVPSEVQVLVEAKLLDSTWHLEKYPSSEDEGLFWRSS